MAFLQFAPLRLLLRGVALGLLSALIALILGFAGAFGPLERGASDLLFRLRGPRAAQSHVVLLVIDEATIAKAGRQPLPRRFYAQAFDKLRAAGAKTVALDFVFGSASDDAVQDAAVVRAAAELAASRNVVQGIIFDVPGASPNARTLARLPNYAIADLGARARLGLSVSAPLPSLMGPNIGLGHLNLHPESDGSFRRVPHLIRFQDRLYPSLSLAIAARDLGLKLSDLSATAGQVTLNRGSAAALSIPLNRNGEVLVNWCGGDGTFATYSLAQLLDNRVPRGALQGATVVIGSALTGYFTPISTPFSSNQTTLHLQAQAIDDIESGRILRPLSVGVSLLILSLFSMGAGALSAPRGALGALGWTVFGTVLLWGAALGALRLNFYFPLVTAQIALLLTSAACLGVRQLFEARELRLMHNLFDGYVGEEVLRFIKSHKPKLDGEVRHVAVLFCDIRGFSTLSEKLKDEPEKLLRLLNDHFEPLVQSLKEHGAYVDNYIGDEVMAVFGAPVSQQAADRNTRSAVLAALDVQRLVENRNRQRQEKGEAPIRIGIGVHCGPAVVGDLGTRKKKHYTAIGDTVNIASRVERETRNFHTELLITEDVVQACLDHPETQNLKWNFVAETVVKGRVGALRLYSNAIASRNQQVTQIFSDPNR